jgi:serine/threonine protein kinase/O-acetyl-ADP-ribose deacetylase (regulator of RNase III)
MSEAARHVDKVCDRFEAAWLAGQRPRIEDYLDTVSGPERSALLRELLQLDLHYRCCGGENPTAEEYVALFSQHRELIVRLVEERSAGPQDEQSAVESPAGSETSPLSPQAPEQRTPDMPTIPGYRIESELGRGSMGVVYKAWQLKLDRRVAIKVVLPGGQVERFLRETKLLAQVNSPFVVAVHDSAVLPDGSPILVMEWVEGTNLLEMIRLRGGQISEEEALLWMRQTSAGMLAAAERGIVHRDFKPSNVLIDEKGRARVADFGLARGPHGSRDLTSVGAIMGTPFYMAPEQAEDPRLVDTRADIYSFGTTFYHALTGVPPFLGKTQFSILFKHKTKPLTSPKQVNPAISERTSELLERCLAKSPNDRFSTFAQVLRQLEPRAGGPSPWDASDDPQLGGYLQRYYARRKAYLREFRLGTAEVDTYEFPQGRKLRILGGDLVKQEVDAIVSSDTCSLTMEYGVSLAIRIAAGVGYAAEVRRYERVLPGRAVVTSAGSLPARYVFHGVTIGETPQDRLILPSPDLISEIMASCFHHADTLSVSTIAFPLLGTGGAGFSKPVCLDTMFRFLARTLLRGLTSVQEATIVIFE